MKARVLITALSLFTASPMILAQSQPPATTPATASQVTLANKQAMVNLNTADANAISKAMKGIGVKRAEAIVKYRTEHGNFKSLDDLSEVSGLSKKFVISHFEQLQQSFSLK